MLPANTAKLALSVWAALLPLMLQLLGKMRIIRQLLLLMLLLQSLSINTLPFFFLFSYSFSATSSFSTAFPYPATHSSGSSSRPRLKEFQFGPSLIDGKSVRVFCNLHDLTGTAVSFQWLKDGVPISTAASPHISIANFADYSSLAINRVDRRRDNGNYTCRAANSAGTDQFSSVLNVQG